MDDLEVAIGTQIRLLEDFPSETLSYIVIPSGTLGTIVDFERHDRTGEIILYHATVYYWMLEECLYLHPCEFEVVDEDEWGDGPYKFGLNPDDFDGE